MANTFPSSGNAGIGTTSPSELLEVQDNSPTVKIKGGASSGQKTTLVLEEQSQNDGERLLFRRGQASGTIQDRWQMLVNGSENSTDDGTGSDLRLQSQVNNGGWVDRVLIARSSGYCGIGAGTPSAQMHILNTPYVSGTSPTLKMTNAHADAVLVDAYSNNTGGSYAGASVGGSVRILLTPCFGGYAAIIGTTGDNELRVVTNATTRMFIAGGGNVGIGTTSPDAKLQVDGDTYQNGGQRIKINTISGNTTLDATYYTVLVTTSAGGTINVTLPSASSHAGREYRIKNKGPGAVQIVGTVDGASGGFLLGGENDAVTVISDGSAWFIL